MRALTILLLCGTLACAADAPKQAKPAEIPVQAQVDLWQARAVQLEAQLAAAQAEAQHWKAAYFQAATPNIVQAEMTSEQNFNAAAQKARAAQAKAQADQDKAEKDKSPKSK